MKYMHLIPVMLLSLAALSCSGSSTSTGIDEKLIGRWDSLTPFAGDKFVTLQFSDSSITIITEGKPITGEYELRDDTIVISVGDSMPRYWEYRFENETLVIRPKDVQREFRFRRS